MVGQQGTASGMFFGSGCDKVKPKSDSLPVHPKTMINVTYVSISKGDSSRFYV